MKRYRIVLPFVALLLLAGCATTPSETVSLPEDYPSVPVIEEGITDITEVDVDGNLKYVLTYSDATESMFKELAVELKEDGYELTELPPVPADGSEDPNGTAVAYGKDDRLAVIVWIPENIFGNGLMNYENYTQ